MKIQVTSQKDEERENNKKIEINKRIIKMSYEEVKRRTNETEKKEFRDKNIKIKTGLKKKERRKNIF